MSFLLARSFIREKTLESVLVKYVWGAHKTVHTQKSQMQANSQLDGRKDLDACGETNGSRGIPQLDADRANADSPNANISAEMLLSDLLISCSAFVMPAPVTSHLDTPTTTLLAIVAARHSLQPSPDLDPDPDPDSS